MCNSIHRRRGIAIDEAWAIVVALSPADHQRTTPSMDALQRFIEGPLADRGDVVLTPPERMALDLAHHIATHAAAGHTVVAADEARQLVELVGHVVARLAAQVPAVSRGTRV